MLPISDNIYYEMQIYFSKVTIYTTLSCENWSVQFDLKVQGTGQLEHEMTATPKKISTASESHVFKKTCHFVPPYNTFCKD